MTGARRTLRRLLRRLLPGLRHLPSSEWRRCGACERRTLVVALSAGDEFRRCVRCGANRRYELLAEWLRANVALEDAVVVELDPASPLRGLLGRAREHVRGFHDAAPGAPRVRPDGARNLDVQALDLPDASVDVLVSSDVLEHVPDLDAAFAETRRVLRPGGVHAFTVPPRERTRRRARVLGDGAVEHLAPPELHADPLRPEGILCFWDVGTSDAPERFGRPGLALAVAAGPAGRDGRVVWVARRTSA